MAELASIARPYAEAAFRLARDTDSLAQWSDLLSLAATVASEPAMGKCIANPELGADKLAELFASVCGERLDGAAKNFVRVLAENRRLQVLPQIAHQFEQLKAQHEGVLKAQVATAFPLSDEQLKDLIAQLEARFRRKIEVEVSIDPELIGGVRVTIGDQVIDASVQGKLKAMAAALTH